MKNPEGRSSKADEAIMEKLVSCLRYSGNSDMPLKNAILLWRNAYTISESQKKQCQEWLLEEIDKRTEAVVGGGYRHSYHKAAELIVVMGEILEEGGETGGMRRLIEKYKSIHSRKSAFRKEIEELSRPCTY